ncbi:MAG: tripartite tricarboxylate transporter TctB family protein [Alphaproteobacteria bacterium]
MADRDADGWRLGGHRASILVELGFWLALALVAFGLSFTFADESGTYRWGAASWPRAVCLLMAVTALLHAWFRLQDSGVAKVSEEREERGDLAGSLGLFAIPLAYALLLPRTGFYLTTPLFLIAFLLYVGERRWSVLLATTASITALVFLVFARVFFVALPVGNWPGFYELNTWFLTVVR